MIKTRLGTGISVPGAVSLNQIVWSVNCPLGAKNPCLMIQHDYMSTGATWYPEHPYGYNRMDQTTTEKFKY